MDTYQYRYGTETKKSRTLLSGLKGLKIQFSWETNDNLTT